VISTVGNPDFAGALMGIFLIINFGVLIQTKQKTWLRIFSGLNAFLLLVVIVFSQVRQGLLAAGFGVIIVTIVWLHQRQKFMAFALTTLMALMGSLSVFGMLNKGLLAKYFYKMSITYRGDYWRAGWQMFIHNPLFGVGLDRYGANFRSYRDATQSLRRGPDLVSNAAHNVPIQLLATGGIFVFIAYFSVTVFIFCRGVVSLKKFQGGEQIIAAGIFAAWLAYEAQSFVSIDNLGVAIWGYVLGGAVVGISCTSTKSSMKSSLPQSMVSGSLALLMFILSSFFFRAEAAIHALRTQSSPQTQEQVVAFETKLKQSLAYNLKEPSFREILAGDLAFVSDFESAISQLKDITESDPLNYDAQVLLAKIYEYQKNWLKAVQVRNMIYTIDPYNQINLLALGEDEKVTGNFLKAKNIARLIQSFAPNSTEAHQALQDFGK
jgi:tetratricopeptide (TPR) repeat protein